MTSPRWPLLPAAVACLAAACRPDAPSGYFPLDEGLAWSYKVTKTTPYKRDVSTLRIENLGAQDVGGEAHHVRKTSSGNFYYLQRLNDGIVRTSKRTLIERRPRRLAYDRFVLKFPPTPGTRWSYQVKPYLLARPFREEVELRRAFDYQMDWRIVADDADVETPAGRFDGCLHVRGEARMEIARSLSVARDTVVFRTDEWYAPGVGLVLLEHAEIVDSDQAYGGSIKMSLTGFSY